MEPVQELARQGIPFKNGDFCRMLFLRGKDDAEVAKH